MTDKDSWRAFLTYIAPERRPLKIEPQPLIGKRIAIIVSVALILGSAVAIYSCHKNLAAKGEVRP